VWVPSDLAGVRQVVRRLEAQPSEKQAAEREAAVMREQVYRDRAAEIGALRLSAGERFGRYEIETDLSGEIAEVDRLIGQSAETLGRYGVKARLRAGAR
jgi:hypothetical protein